MQDSISSVLRMWPHSAGHAERFVNAYLGSLGYALENVAPLGGKDGGRDLQSFDGSLVVACYFPIKEYMPYEKIKKKFMADVKSAHEHSAESFIFVTGQILQLAEKRKLTKLSPIADTKVYDCLDILNKVCAPESGYLRAELGFPDDKASPEKDFFRRLYKKISFTHLIKLILDSAPPRKYSKGFIAFFDSIDEFRRSAFPQVLGPELEKAFYKWDEAARKFEGHLNDPDRFDTIDAPLGYAITKMPYPELQRVSAEVNVVFQSLHQETIALARLVAEKHKIPSS